MKITKRLTKRSKHIYIVTQKSGTNILLNIKLKYIQKIPLKYVVINRNKFNFSSLYSKQLFQQKALRSYYGFIGKRYLRMLYIKAKKYNIHKAKIFTQWIEYKLDRFLVKIWFLGSIYQAKQYILHGKIYVSSESKHNRCIVNNSYIVKFGDIITVRKNDSLLLQQQIKKKFLLPKLLLKLKHYNKITGFRYTYKIFTNYLLFIDTLNNNLKLLFNYK